MLARWSGWGSLPQVFDEANDPYAEAREQARRLLGDEAAWTAARRTTLNAHYTPAEVVAAMWRAVADLGFDGGRVLEPGCGSGNFIGLAPDGCELTGVEVDATTAAVARHLYGARATIRARALRDLRRARRALRPGDRQRPLRQGHPARPPPQPRPARAAQLLPRQEPAPHPPRRPGRGAHLPLHPRRPQPGGPPGDRARADLVGAVRFPAGAFMGSAGTDVVGDLLVLRRRGAGDDRRGHRWTTTVPAPIDDGGEPLFVNEYFVATRTTCSARSPPTAACTARASSPSRRPGRLPALDQALDSLVADARARGLVLSPRTASRIRSRRPSPPRRRRCASPKRAASCSPTVDSVGWRTARSGPTSPGSQRRGGAAPPGGAARRRPRRARGAGRRRRRSRPARPASQPHRRYDAYRRVYGPLNRFSMARTGRPDPETGEEVLRRLRPRMGGFRDDPDWPLVAALEVFDDETQQARQAAIFTERIIAPPVPASASTPRPRRSPSASTSPARSTSTGSRSCSAPTRRRPGPS